MAQSMAEALGKAGLISKERQKQILSEKKGGEQSAINFNLKALEQKGVLDEIRKVAQKAPHGVCPHCGRAVKTYRDPKNHARSLIAFHSFEGCTCPGSQEPPEKSV